MKKFIFTLLIFLSALSYSQEKFLIVTHKKTKKTKVFRGKTRLVVKNKNGEKFRGKLFFSNENSILMHNNKKNSVIQLNEIKYISSGLSFREIFFHQIFLPSLSAFIYYAVLIITSRQSSPEGYNSLSDSEKQAIRRDVINNRTFAAIGILVAIGNAIIAPDIYLKKYKNTEYNYSIILVK